MAHHVGTTTQAMIQAASVPWPVPNEMPCSVPLDAEVDELVQLLKDVCPEINLDTVWFVEGVKRSGNMRGSTSRRDTYSGKERRH